MIILNLKKNINNFKSHFYLTSKHELSSKVKSDFYLCLNEQIILKKIQFNRQEGAKQGFFANYSKVTQNNL